MQNKPESPLWSGLTLLAFAGGLTFLARRFGVIGTVLVTAPIRAVNRRRFA